MVNRLFRAILNSSVIMSWTSLISRLGMAAIVLPFIVVNLSETDISLWFFILILSRFKDLFDFGYLDNIARKASYYKGEKEGGKIKHLYFFSLDVYKKNSMYCFFALLFLAVLGLYLKSMLPADRIIEMSILVVLIAISNSIFIFGNRYVSILFGLDYISQIKSWDTLFTLLNIISLISVMLYSPALWAIVIINSFWTILTVIRNRYFCNKIVRELSGHAIVTCNSGFQSIKLNSKKDYFASLLSMGYIQLFNYLVSVFLPVGISNAYLLLDNIMEQIKNISRIPFYVNRPKMARDFKSTGVLNYTDVRRYMLSSSATLAIGVFLFAILGPFLLLAIGSKVVFDLYIWITLAIFASIERLSAMHNQLYVIVTDEVIVHKLLARTMMFVTVIIFIFYFLNFKYFIYPLSFAISYLVVFYPPLVKYNLCFFKISFLKFEVFNLLTCTFLVFSLFLLFFWLG